MKPSQLTRYSKQIDSMLPCVCSALVQHYSITKAKRALCLVNSASTICPWVSAADVCANVCKANILKDIVSKVMAVVGYRPKKEDFDHVSGNVIKLDRVAGVQSVVMNEFSRTCFLFNLLCCLTV